MYRAAHRAAQDAGSCGGAAQTLQRFLIVTEMKDPTQVVLKHGMDVVKSHFREMTTNGHRPQPRALSLDPCPTNTPGYIACILHPPRRP
jgi:hypothetical protein